MAPSKGEVDRRMRAFVDACRQGGLKITHQRTEIFRQLVSTEDHPDAETVFARTQRRIPTVSRDTVYRTLALLEAQGLIRRVDVFRGRARFDAVTEPHHHFICSRCGLVRDFTSKTLDAFRPPRQVLSWGDVAYAQVQLRGTCARCKSKRSREQPTR